MVRCAPFHIRDVPRPFLFGTCPLTAHSEPSPVSAFRETKELPFPVPLVSFKCQVCLNFHSWTKQEHMKKKKSPPNKQPKTHPKRPCIHMHRYQISDHSSVGWVGNETWPVSGHKVLLWGDEMLCNLIKKIVVHHGNCKNTTELFALKWLILYGMSFSPIFKTIIVKTLSIF